MHPLAQALLATVALSLLATTALALAAHGLKRWRADFFSAPETLDPLPSVNSPRGDDGSAVAGSFFGPGDRSAHNQLTRTTEHRYHG